MTRKTDGEKIDELEKLVATLLKRADTARREMIDRADFAVVKERLDKLDKKVDEARSRRWSFWSSLAGLLVGAILNFLGQLAINYLRDR